MQLCTAQCSQHAGWLAPAPRPAPREGGGRPPPPPRPRSLRRRGLPRQQRGVAGQRARRRHRRFQLGRLRLGGRRLLRCLRLLPGRAGEQGQQAAAGGDEGGQVLLGLRAQRSGAVTATTMSRTARQAAASLTTGWSQAGEPQRPQTACHPAGKATQAGRPTLASVAEEVSICSAPARSPLLAWIGASTLSTCRASRQWRSGWAGGGDGSRAGAFSAPLWPTSMCPSQHQRVQPAPPTHLRHQLRVAQLRVRRLERLRQQHARIAIVAAAVRAQAVAYQRRRPAGGGCGAHAAGWRRQEQEPCQRAGCHG